MILEGLGVNQTVKIGDNYLVQLPSGEYEVDGQRIKGNYNGVQVMLSSDGLNSIKKVIPARRELTHYLNEETGDTYTVDEYQTARNELWKYFDEDMEEYNFPDLDTEYEVRKRLDPITKAIGQYKDVAEELIDYKDVKVVGEHIDTGSRHITTPYMIGKAPQTDSFFKVNVLGVLKSEFGKLVKENPDWDVDIPSHSELEYVKVNGEYVFASRSPHYYKKQSYRTFTSLEDAKGCEHQLRQEIRKCVLSKTTKEKLSKDQLAEVVSNLESIKAMMVKIDVKRASESDKRIADKKINDLLEGLRSSVLC